MRWRSNCVQNNASDLPLADIAVRFGVGDLQLVRDLRRRSAVRLMSSNPA